MTEPWWRTVALSDMSHAQWESLCDGCGKCCLLKLEDDEAGTIDFTDVACRLLDCETCGCRDYDHRKAEVPDCVALNAQTLHEVNFMPSTCAYKVLAEGKDLAWWHPLVSGDRQSVHEAGISVRGRCVSETEVPDADLEAHIVEWPR